MKTKIEIKSISGEVLFSYETENNTTKKTVEKAVNLGINLNYVNLQEVDLSNIVLDGINLIGANLSKTNLSCASLNKTNMHGANLFGAFLKKAQLIETNLRGANLSYTFLYGANLSKAKLERSNFYHSVLVDANLEDAIYDESTCFLLPQCPEEGSFIGWKRVNGYLIKLLILEDAKRSSATTLLCRCSKAKILNILNFDSTPTNITEIAPDNDYDFVYKKGETITVDNFDKNRWHDSYTYIGFFMSKEAAITYI